MLYGSFENINKLEAEDKIFLKLALASEHHDMNIAQTHTDDAD